MNKQVLGRACGKIPSSARLIGRLRKLFRSARHHRVYMSFVRSADASHFRFHQYDLPKTPISRRTCHRCSQRVARMLPRSSAMSLPPTR